MKGSAMRSLVWLWVFTGVLIASARSEELTTVFEQHLSPLIAREIEAKGIPGFAIAIVDDHGILWSGFYGTRDLAGTLAVTKDTVFRSGSATEMFTNIAIMNLVEKGVLDIDKPVAHYIPEFRPKNPFGGAITLRHLMSHQSGLVREPLVGSYFETSPPSLKEIVLSLNHTALVAKPGGRVKYSNAGLAVVGHVLERTLGKPYEDILREEVLQKAGMSAAALKLTPQVKQNLAQGLMVTYDGVPFEAPVFDVGVAPAGNLYATVDDLATVAVVLLNEGKTGSGALLKPETLRAMWQPQSKDTQNFALGFMLGDLDGEKSVGRGGAVYGFTTHFEILPARRLGVVAVATVDGASATATRIARHALRLTLAARENKALPPFIFSEPVEKAARDALHGHYTDGRERVFLRAWRGHLYLEGLGRAAEVRRLGSGWALDDAQNFSPDIAVDPALGTVTLAGRTFRKTGWEKPAPPAPELVGLIGEYGWPHSTLRIYEWDGALHARLHGLVYERLTKVGADVYAFPKDTGFLPGEVLEFRRDESGRAASVSLSGIVFARRDFGQEIEDRIKAKVRSSATLREEARAAVPPVETGTFRPSDLVSLDGRHPLIRFDIRYATTHNFMGIVFYPKAAAFLQRPAAEALIAVQNRLASKGYGLLIHDAYRPWYVTKMFWDAMPAEGKLFVADPAQGSRHNRGCAVDLTLYDLKTGAVVEMPGRYDELSARSSPGYIGGSSLARWERDILRQTMEESGFHVYEHEWWHFDYKDWHYYPIHNTDFADLGVAGD